MKARRSGGVAALLVALTLAGCAAARLGPGDLPVSDYAGHYTGGAGASWFRPCTATAGDSLWWATFMGPAVAQLASHREAGRVPDGSPVFLSVRAALSDRQASGADRMGTRYVYVHEILDVRPPAPADCGR